ncbi:hypothetical protein [Actinoplanes sp. NPDC049599]|uniref:hypothetical protein n=1 Tax=Actinoplanes sp. NPDC049599 TaxID=3363903 RepID=UPI003789850D
MNLYAVLLTGLFAGGVSYAAAPVGSPSGLVMRQRHHSTTGSRDTDGCVRAFVIPRRDIRWILPAGGDTVIELGILQPGRLDYSCGVVAAGHTA